MNHRISLGIVLALLSAARASIACGDGSIAVAILPQMTAGFPIPIEVSVVGPTSIVASRITAHLNPLRWVLSGEGQEYVVEQVLSNPTEGFDKRLAPPHYNDPRSLSQATTVAEGAKLATLIDGANIGLRVNRNPGYETMAGEELQPGSYVVSGSGSDLPIVVSPTSVLFAAPNEMERKLLQNLDSVCANDSPTRPRWAVFAIRSTEVLKGVSVGALQATTRRQLQYYQILARLVASELPIADLQIPAEELEGLWSGYEPEVWLLRYEIALAKGAAEEAEGLRSQALARRPNAADVLDQIRSGDGRIKRYRTIKLASQR